MEYRDNQLAKQRFSYLMVAGAIFLLDQVTKQLAASLGRGSSLRVIDGFFHLTYVENAGIAWGFFADAGNGGRLVLGVISLMAVIGIIVYALRTPTSERATHLGLTLVLGGVLGNFTDRLLRGAVVDFLDFTIGSYKWPTFNIADMAISLGAVVLIIDALRSTPEERPTQPVESVPGE